MARSGVSTECAIRGRLSEKCCIRRSCKSIRASSAENCPRPVTSTSTLATQIEAVLVGIGEPADRTRGHVDLKQSFSKLGWQVTLLLIQGAVRVPDVLESGVRPHLRPEPHRSTFWPQAAELAVLNAR